jgi:hypothetical protein
MTAVTYRGSSLSEEQVVMLWRSLLRALRLEENDNPAVCRISKKGRELNTDDPGQVLYRGIMGALGYSKNKEPCRRLADIVPLARLEEANLSEEEIEELLLVTHSKVPGERTANLAVG